MEHKQHVKFFLVLALALLPALVFGYDNTKTHPMLTGEAIKLFEVNNKTPFSGDGNQQIIRGSVDEDDVPRWLEHFYDPINNRGLNGGQFATSKKWSHGQNSTGNDYSWENAIYEYVYGDKNKGLYALGHIMHLVQDATVPDHTRDDPHPFVKTYEDYAYRQNSVARSEPIYLSSIDSYFDSAANFSNTNFFSDDTILKYYPNPKPIRVLQERERDGSFGSYGWNNYGRLVRVNKWWDVYGDTHIDYSISDTDNKVMSDYWNTLAPKAVGYSAGVIKLFLSEVEKEKETGALKKARMPWWEKLLESMRVRVGQMLASVNFALDNQKQVVPPEGQVSEEKKLVEDNSQPEASDREKLLETKDKLQKLQEELAGLAGKEEGVVLPAIRSANSLVSSLGGETINVEAPTTTASTTIFVSSPIITSPADFSQPFATTTIIFSGTASSGMVIFNDFDRGQATTSEAGEWVMIINNLPQGSSTIQFFARDVEDNVSDPTSISLTVDSLPLQINLNISNCLDSLATDFCLLFPTSTVRLSWLATKPGNYKYDLLKFDENSREALPETIASSLENNEYSASSNLSAQDLLKELSWQIIARDASSSEVKASSSKIVTIFHPRPLVINEIGWAGTVASNLDEWFEIRNYLFRPLELNNYFVTDQNKTWQINLTGSIESDGYYLVERNDDNVISNRPAQLVNNFVPDPSAKAFPLNSFGLKLWHKGNVGDELVDETPVWNKGASMVSSLERNWESRVSTDLATWLDNFFCSESDEPCALDRNATTTFGTPGVLNTASIPRLW